MPPKSRWITDEEFTMATYKRIAEENQEIPNKISGVDYNKAVCYTFSNTSLIFSLRSFILYGFLMNPTAPVFRKSP